MKERPIIMQEDSVLGVLEGRKRQTRRVCKYRVTGPNPPGDIYDMYDGGRWIGAFPNAGKISSAALNCPYGKPGDRLWVKEAFAGNGDDLVYWRAGSEYPTSLVTTWKSPIFMSRWASRITLEIQMVRVERVQAISQADAFAEGCLGTECYRNPRFIGYVTDSGKLPEEEYRELWDSINGKRNGGIYAWQKNPWVWVLEFNRV